MQEDIYLNLSEYFGYFYRLHLIVSGQCAIYRHFVTLRFNIYVLQTVLVSLVSFELNASPY